MNIQKKFIFLFFITSTLQIYGFGCWSKSDDLTHVDEQPYTDAWFKRQIKRLKQAKAVDEDQRKKFAGGVLLAIAFNGAMQQDKKQAAVSEILRQGAPVDFETGDGKTPLYYSIIANKDFALAQQLIEARASVTLSTSLSYSADYVTQAQREDSPQLLETLIKAKASLGLEDVAEHESFNIEQATISMCRSKDTFEVLAPYLRDLTHRSTIHNMLVDKRDPSFLDWVLNRGAIPCSCTERPDNCPKFFPHALAIHKNWQAEATQALNRAVPVKDVQNIIKEYLYKKWY